ncbi:hypothetical protein [Aquimarina aggregata]|uniref:hypothetical protein n=1 Tax=Aquimarina aggregata TaxID=1642818 RepID=UPI0024916683|nr:hypothetical protein [Aquimarina aggregata]
MIYTKFSTHFRIYSYIVIILFSVNSGFSQTVQQEKMEKLSYLVGEWIGTSTIYKNDSITKQVPVFENVSFKLDKNIITLDVYSELIQLHTIIYYDEKDEKYYYNPFSKNGAGKYPGEYKDGKFIVWFNENRRLIFSLTPEGYFQEYGEKLENGIWHKYFEDVLKKTP